MESLLFLLALILHGCAQSGRQALIDEVKEKGFISIKSARRRGQQGRFFNILDGDLFTVEGPDGEVSLASSLSLHSNA